MITLNSYTLRFLMSTQFIHLVCLLFTAPVNSFPQLLLPNNFAVTVALDSPQTFDNISPKSDDPANLLKAFYSSDSTSDLDQTPVVAESPDNPDTATDWVDKLSLVNLGTKFRYNSPNAGGKFDEPIQPSSPSLFDLASTETSDSEFAGNVNALPSGMDYGTGGGTGSGTNLPPTGAPSSGVGPVLLLPLLGSKYKPIVPSQKPPKRPKESQQQPWLDDQGRHEDESDPPDCGIYPGNYRVLFCCQTRKKTPVLVTNNPATRAANCVLCTSFLPSPLHIRVITRS